MTMLFYAGRQSGTWKNESMNIEKSGVLRFETCTGPVCFWRPRQRQLIVPFTLTVKTRKSGVTTDADGQKQSAYLSRPEMSGVCGRSRGYNPVPIIRLLGK